MEVQKIFSSEDGERLYSVLLSEGELKAFADHMPYDDTDNIKRMKDSDIIAENRKSNARSYLGAAKAGMAGASLGAVAGGVASLTSAGKKLGLGSKSLGIGKLKTGNKFVQGAALGAAALGTVAGTGALALGHKKRESNRAYNGRLREAQRQSKRREKTDWKNQTVNREGYSF